MYGDFDAIAEIGGTLSGVKYITEDQDQYIDMLVTDAHQDVSKEFDMAAAASGRYISHMFEYGTAGITPGATKFAPLDPRARLWEHRLIGKGGHKEVSFVFRPATMPNPRPTTASTGVKQEYLRHLSNRKYIFWNRALVTEMGTEVNISAKNGKWLFVPFYGNPSYSNPNNNRGYMMWNSDQFGPIKATPGRTKVGRFGALWDGWWSGVGDSMLSNKVYEQYNDDLKAAIAAAEIRAKRRSMKPSGLIAASNKKVHARAKKSAATTFMSRALGRVRKK